MTERCAVCGKVFGFGSDSERPFITVHTRRLMRKEDPHADARSTVLVCEDPNCRIHFVAKAGLHDLSRDTEITLVYRTGERLTLDEHNRQQCPRSGIVKTTQRNSAEGILDPYGFIFW